MNLKFLLTCEHGGNRIPACYRGLFAGCEPLLASHRGWDPGALVLARDFASALRAKLFHSTTSRLLVELNRSMGHPQLFSAPVRGLPRRAREELVERFYRPYRDRVEARIAAEASRGELVVHLSCHSFTPVLDGVERNADIGLLFDPRHSLETQVCAAWQQQLRASDASLVVRRNYPYRGTNDGFTTYLRRRFDERNYLGIELEVNQKFPMGEAPGWEALRPKLIRSFAEAVTVLRPAQSGGRVASAAPVGSRHAPVAPYGHRALPAFGRVAPALRAGK